MASMNPYSLFLLTSRVSQQPRLYVRTRSGERYYGTLLDVLMPPDTKDGFSLHAVVLLEVKEGQKIRVPSENTRRYDDQYWKVYIPAENVESWQEFDHYVEGEVRSW